MTSRALHFTIVIPAYNVASWVRENLVSAALQNYPHFDVVYIADASTDSGFESARQLISSLPVDPQ